MYLLFKKSLACTTLFTFAILATIPAMAAVDVLHVEVSPEPGYVKEEIKSVSITFEGVKSIAFSSRALLYYDPAETIDKTGIIYFGGDEIDQSPDMYTASTEGNTITFTVNPDKPWTPMGKYQLSIPKGALLLTMDNGSVNSNWSCDYNFVYGEGANMIVSIEAYSIVSDMSTITLELPEGYEFSGGYPMPLYYPCLYGATSSGKRDYQDKIAYYQLLNAPIAGKTKLEYGNLKTFYPIADYTPVEGKTYCLYIPTSSLNIKNTETGVIVKNQPIEIPFTYEPNTSGIQTLSIASNNPGETLNLQDNDKSSNYDCDNNSKVDSNITVYSLQGQQILKDAPKSTLQYLPAGLYIINSHRIFIGKQ